MQLILYSGPYGPEQPGKSAPVSDTGGIPVLTSGIDAPISKF